MPKAILAQIIEGNQWECKLCNIVNPRRIKEVTAMMIHLVTVHHINLEFQSFPQGILQEGMIFHLVASTGEKTYEELFTSPLKKRD